MMVRYRSRARDDIQSIYDQIARNNPPAARHVTNAIRAAGELLAAEPELGVAMGHKDARRWPMPEYRYAIFYRIDWEADCIDVLRVVAAQRVRNLKRVPK